MQSLAARIILSIIIGVVAWAITYVVGLLLKDLTILDLTGSFLVSISVILGFAAGIWYFITQKNPLR